MGLKLDIGAPDGIGVSLIARPLKFLDFDLGGTTTISGGGIRGGLTLYAPWVLSPTLSIDGGHQWGGDFNRVPTILFGTPDPGVSLLRNVQYDYLNVRAGFGLGHHNWFYIRLMIGYSYVVYQTNGLNEFVQQTAQDTSILVKEATIKAWTPSASMVIVFHFPPRF